MNITLLGSGNVATHLGLALKAAGHDIIQVWSRSEVNAVALAEKLGAQPISAISALNRSAELYLIAVKDDAIAELVSALPFPDLTIVHTSGSTSLSALAGVSSRIGVLYPIQTLSKDKSVNFKEIPIAIEANTESVANMLQTLAESITSKVIKLSSEQRVTLHMAAVFACNFTNYFYTVAQDILAKEHLHFDLLRPLIIETAQKVLAHDPSQMQTGPARRHDQHTVNKHLELLKADAVYAKLYDSLSTLIMDRYK